MERFVVITGCSGSGKSTLLEELAGRGYHTVEEPGRRIIAEERRNNGTALPWCDLAAFARRAIDLAVMDRTRLAAAVKGNAWVFFDRGLVDAAVALQHATGAPALDLRARECRYHRLVFMSPPWPEIYAKDDDRQHDLTSAVAEYERLLRSYPKLGYEVVTLPKAPVGERADFILRSLGELSGPS